jgi:hypothetical protein
MDRPVGIGMVKGERQSMQSSYFGTISAESTSHLDNRCVFNWTRSCFTSRKSSYCVCIKKKLSMTQQRYSTMEKEAMVFHWAVTEKFPLFLKGNNFAGKQIISLWRCYSMKTHHCQILHHLECTDGQGICNHIDTRLLANDQKKFRWRIVCQDFHMKQRMRRSQRFNMWLYLSHVHWQWNIFEKLPKKMANSKRLWKSLLEVTKFDTDAFQR